MNKKRYIHSLATLGIMLLTNCKKGALLQNKVIDAVKNAEIAKAELF